jgi:hypothetical protein
MNKNQFNDGSEIFTFEGNQSLIFRFEEFIKKHQTGRSLPHGTPTNPTPPIETAALAAIEMLESFKQTVPHDTKKDYRSIWRQAIALGDVLRKLENGTRYPGFTGLWPHINLLLKNCNIAQNTSHPREDSDGDKVFELYTALLLLPLCSALEVDDPVHSAGGTNPDFIATIDGVRWAFACKVMHTDSPKTFLQTVRKAVEQIGEADAQKGVVIVSLKSVTQHDRLWPAVLDPDTKDYIYFPWADEAQPVNQLLALCQQYEQSKVDEVLLRDALQKELAADGIVPTVLLHLCTTGSLDVSGKIIPCMPRMLYGLTVGSIAPEDQSVLDNLNNSLHDRFVDFSASSTAAAAPTN